MSAPAISASAPLSLSRSEAQRHLWEVATNVALSLLFLRFAVVQGEAAWHTQRLSTFLLLSKVTADMVFYLIRRMPKGTSISLYDWGIGISGTFLPVLFGAQQEGFDRTLGQVLQLTGVALQIVSMLSLNRSIGMVAANRGVKTGGLYRLVRHPLYMSYAIAFLGYLLSHPTAGNFAVYGALCTLYVLRLRAEERFLMKDAGYRAYASRVSSKLIPLVY